MSLIKYDLDGVVEWSSSDGSIILVSVPGAGGTGGGTEMPLGTLQLDAPIPTVQQLDSLGNPMVGNLVISPAAIEFSGPPPAVEFVGGGGIIGLTPGPGTLGSDAPVGPVAATVVAPFSTTQFDAVVPIAASGGDVDPPVLEISTHGEIGAATTCSVTLFPPPGVVQFDGIVTNPLKFVKLVVNVDILVPVSVTQFDAPAPSDLGTTLYPPPAQILFDAPFVRPSFNPPSDLTATLPSLECEMYSASQITASIPALTFEAYVNYRNIEAEIPSLTMTADLFTGHAIDMEATIPMLTMEMSNGAEIDATIPSLTCSIEVDVMTMVDIDATIPTMTCAIEVTDTTPADIACTLPAMTCLISGIQGGVGDITASIPMLICTLADVDTETITMIGRIPRLSCDMDVVPSGTNAISASVPTLTMVAKICEREDEVMRHVMNLEYLEASLPEIRFYGVIS